MVVFALPEGGRAKTDFGRVCEGKKKAQTAEKKRYGRDFAHV
jgi:hypothetical protein